MKLTRLMLPAVAALGFFSCTQALPQDPLKSFEAVTPQQTQTLQDVPVPPAGMAAAAAGQGSSRDILLQLRTGRAVGPRDYWIGPLDEGAGPDQKAAKAALRDFLNTLGKKSPDFSLVHLKWKTLITSVLDLQKDNWPETYRLGQAVVETEGLVRVTVGLTGPKGRSDGWIFMERDGQAWLVSDWQVDLLVPSPRTEEEFDPEGFPLVRGFP